MEEGNTVRINHTQTFSRHHQNLTSVLSGCTSRRKEKKREEKKNRKQGIGGNLFFTLNVFRVNFFLLASPGSSDGGGSR
jgi:hypothetical protein